jgi:hypothetical protein
MLSFGIVWGAGLAKNPTAQHFSPVAKACIEARGAKVLLLPPKGKFFNPIEMVFGGLKKSIETSEWSRQAAKDARCMTEFEMTKALDAAAEVVKSQIKGYFKERSGLNNFAKHYDVKVLDTTQNAAILTRKTCTKKARRSRLARKIRRTLNKQRFP